MSEQRWAVMSAEGSGWLVVHPGDVRRYDGLLDCWDVHSRHQGRPRYRLTEVLAYLTRNDPPQHQDTTSAPGLDKNG